MVDLVRSTKLMATLHVFNVMVCMFQEPKQVSKLVVLVLFLLLDGKKLRSY
jgi:hypothetical protein